MTTDHRDDSAALRAALIADAQERAGEHPDLDTLVDYLAEGLDPEAEEGVRDHLAACRDCIDVVLDLEPLSTPDKAPGAVADLEIESAYRELQSRLGTPKTPSRLPSYPWALPLAASLLVATVGMSIWVGHLTQTRADLRRQVAHLSQPQVNVPVFYLDELTRSSESEVSEIEVPSGAGSFVLMVSSSELDQQREYELAFFDAEGREFLRTTGLTVSDSGGLRLGLSQSVLPPGDYRIELRAAGDGESTRVDEFRRQIRYP